MKSEVFNMGRKSILRAILGVLFLGLVIVSVPCLRENVITTAAAEDLKASGKCGTNATYTFDMDKGVLTISGTGEVSAYYFMNQYRIKKVIINKGIRSLNSSCFQNCQRLESVSLPSGLLTIGNSAFKECVNLSSLTIPSSVTEIGTEAFYNCAKLPGIKLPPDITRINSQVFYGCTSITDVTIPSKVTRIEYGAFNGCSFKELTIPAQVEYISYMAFASSTLETATILSKTSGSSLFSYCSNLRTVNISAQTEALPYIGGCYKLEAINIDPKNPNWTSVDGVIYSKDKSILKLYPAAKDIEIPSFVREIARNSFYYAKSGSVIEIPEMVEEINENAFSGTSNDSNFINPIVIIQGHDTFVEQNAFSGIFSPYNTYLYGHEDNSNIKVSHGIIVDMPIVKLKMTEMVDLNIQDDPIFRWYSRDAESISVDTDGFVTPLKRTTTEVYGFNTSKMFRYTVTTGFKDVPENKYYYNAVYWAVDKGITGGVKNSKGVADTFNPEGNCTRAQMVAFIWRMAGCPEPIQEESVFSDIKPSDYFYKAVLWGTQNGIVGGYSDKTFRPQGNCTRAQAVSFLWRYYGKPDPENFDSRFSDNLNSNQYYYKAVLWASENGITGGYSDGTFRPQGSCSRAQMVTFLYRSRDLKK